MFSRTNELHEERNKENKQKNRIYIVHIYYSHRQRVENRQSNHVIKDVSKNETVDIDTVTTQVLNIEFK